MPPLLAGIGAIVGALTTAFTAASAFIASLGIAGSFLVSGALSLGASYLARSLAKKPSGEPVETGPQGAELRLSTDPAAPRQLVLGTRGIAGRLVYWCLSGSNNEFLHLVIVLADHRIERVKNIAVDGKWVTGWTMPPGSTDYSQEIEDFNHESAAHLFVRIMAGTDEQESPSEIQTASGGQWTADHRLRGCAYAWCRLRWHRDVWSGGGVPTFLFEVEGARLYDPRLDSTVAGGSGAHRFDQPLTHEWTDNLEVCRYNFLRGIAWHSGRPRFGPGLPASDLPLGAAIAAMNECGEVVAKIGGSEKRYACNAVIEASESYRSVLERMSVACAGSLPDLSGRYAMLPGAPQVPVMAMTDADLIAGADLTGSRFRSIGEVPNEVTGNWADPASLYQRVALPARWSSDDEEQDGGFRRSEGYDLDYVGSQTQGQRVLEIFRRLGRRQRTHRVTLRRRFAVLEAGDWIGWTSDVFGYEALVFRVEQITLNPDWSVTCELREIDDDVYAWNALVDEVDAANPADLPSAGPTYVEVEDFAVETAVVVSADETQIPALRCTWEAVTDPTVTGIRIEYRRVGDVPWLVYVTSRAQALAGAATIVAGIVGGDFYEAQATPITDPPRLVLTTAPVATDDASPEIIVRKAIVSEVAETVQPSQLTVDHLAPALRRAVIPGFKGSELDDRLLSALMARAIEAEQRRDILLAAAGALRARIEQVRTVLVTDTQALAQIVDALSATIEDPSNGLEALATALTSLTTSVSVLDDDLEALSALVTNLSAQVGDNSANGRVRFVVLTTASGAIASYGIDLETNVAGVFRRASLQIDVTSGGSKVKIVGDTFEVLAAAFRVYHPSYAGGAPVQVFDLSGGVLTLNANLYVNGNAIITGTLTTPSLHPDTRGQVVSSGGTHSATITTKGGRVTLTGRASLNPVSGTASIGQSTNVYIMRANLIIRDLAVRMTMLTSASGGAATFGAEVPLSFADTPPAGTYTYEIRGAGTGLLNGTADFELEETVV